MAKSPDSGPLKLDSFDRPPAIKNIGTNKTDYRDATLGDRNGGLDNKSLGEGQTLVTAFALDRSAVSNSAASERDGVRKLGGGIDNLAHSLKGTSAMQGDDKGRKDRTW